FMKQQVWSRVLAKLTMRNRFTRIIDIYKALAILCWCSNSFLTPSVGADTMKISPVESKCDILNYLLHSAVYKIGQKIEILIAIPDEMMYCPTNLLFSHYLIAIKSCSRKYWTTDNFYSDHCSPGPIYTFLACDLQDSIMILNSTFQKHILRFRWFIFYDSGSSADLRLLGNLSNLDFRLDSFLQLVDGNSPYNLQEAYK
ncbi:unnamed protein product, partial [Allacma fusca]